MHKAAVVTAGLAMLVVAGCSATSVPAPSGSASGGSNSVSQATVAQGYLAAVTTVGIARRQMEAAFATSTTIAQLVAPAHAFADALTTFDGAVADLGATGQAGGDVRALAGDDEVVIADLHSVGSQTGATFLSWRSRTEADGRRSTAASDTVRSALGLPPATAR